MSDSKRGILYIVWGDKCEAILERSIRSVRRYYPEIPIHIERGDAKEGLLQKARMGAVTPFESTLYLDADTIVMGNLDYGFEQAEQFGLACTICECPWLRRYGWDQKDRAEYNTGVIFFSRAAQELFSTWKRIAPTTPATSLYIDREGNSRCAQNDDQASFAQALLAAKWNPFVLPLNWNVRPHFHRRVFAPVKIWHEYREPPPELAVLNDACQVVDQPVRLFDFVDC